MYTHTHIFTLVNWSLTSIVEMWLTGHFTEYIVLL